jgi:hypothetical protein
MLFYIRGEIRHKFKILGKVDSIYEFFALHDYIYNKPDESITIRDINKELIDINEYYENENEDILKNLFENKVEKSRNE